MALGDEMLRLTADSVVADQIELTFMNFTLGYQSKSGLWAAYNVPSDGKITPAMPQMGDPKRPDDCEICCCTVNGPRGFGMLTDWALLQDRDGLALNWYGLSKLTSHVGDTKVVLTQETDYPRTGHIVLHVAPERPTEFTLKLRIPHWSARTTVLVNGEPVEHVTPGRYLSIRREWNPGDVIDLDLDMSVHYWVGDREVAGRASFYRGPILLTYPRKNPKEYLKFNGDWSVYFSARHLPYVDLYGSKRPGDTVSFDFEGDAISWLYNTFENCGKAEVKIDGKRVGVVDQYAPVTYDGLFSYSYDKPNLFLSARWEYKGLAPGKHRIEITVLSEKDEKSADHWINVRELVPSGDDPVFDPHTMGGRLLSPHKGGFPIVEMEFTDVNGRKVCLRDFDSAAENCDPYISWLRAVNAPKTDFTRENPTRSSKCFL
jgi:hypothetical protein